MRPFFAGLIAAPFTPFRPDGGLDLDLVPRLTALLAALGGVNAGKAIMKLCGFDCGPVRLPMKPLTAEACARLHEELRAQGFFEFAASLALVEASPTPAAT